MFDYSYVYMPALQLHARALKTALILYIISSWCSMAGLEIFGWLTFVLAISYWIRDQSIAPQDFFSVFPWKLFLSLLAIVSLGLAVNALPGTDYLFAIGTQRYMILLIGIVVAFLYSFPNARGYRLFLIVISLLALYAIFQSLTGIDLLRPGSDRAVQPMGDAAGTLRYWRAAGPWGSPMQYAYITGLHICLPLAVILLGLEKKSKISKRYFWSAIAVFALVATGILVTYVRGAYIAFVVAILGMTYLIRPRLSLIASAAMASVVSALFILNNSFRARLLNALDMTSFSNASRITMWKINWEIFKDYPVLGIGYHQNEVRAREYAVKIGDPNAFLAGHAHSNYLQMLSGTGALGFLTYMAIISFMLWLTLKLWKSLKLDQLWCRAIVLACFGAQIYLHVGGLTECNFKAGATQHNFMIVWAMVIALAIRLRAKQPMPTFDGKL